MLEGEGGGGGGGVSRRWCGERRGWTNSIHSATYVSKVQ